MVRSESTEFRIVSRPPGKTRFKFRYFTGATPPNRSAATAAIARAERDSPGWEFRLERRTVIRETGRWGRA